MRVTRNILSLILTLTAVTPSPVNAQEVPGPDENVPFLITFGPKAATSWGDDDFSQTFFFTLPKDYKDPFLHQDI
ncbi:MAG: hypothetical protein U5L72_07205 [Bacteroidales bacterium]|nr:hypothetical protein [Bacteroidales bacterium]